MSKRSKLILRISLSGMFLALAMVLPLLTGQIPEIGQKLSPMHIPVLICGFICGWPYGLAVGFFAPLLRFLIFGMPPIYPGGLAMAFEMAVYGLLTGILYVVFVKRNVNNIFAIYVTLIVSMLVGRMVWGVARYLIAVLDGTMVFTFKMFMAGAFINAWPGIILHIILIPAILLALDKANLLNKLNLPEEEITFEEQAEN